MINFEDLEQLTAFAKHGTLVKAAAALHISQPTITRTMKHIEESFGVKLFERGKNRIRLNGTGKIAVEQAEKVLDATQQMMLAVREYDKSLRTIVVESCAPAPLWFALPQLAKKYPAMTLSSSLVGNEEIMEHVRGGQLSCGDCAHASCRARHPLPPLPPGKSLYLPAPESSGASKCTGLP